MSQVVTWRHDSAPDTGRPTGGRTPGAEVYARAVLPWVPRLLTLVDRNPANSTYGCLDRQYWHYRTAAFPSAMYQEGAAVLAMLFRYRLPGNRWFRHLRLKELARAAARFAAIAAHADGSGDDYYPLERALGAAVFSLVAVAHACRLLGIRDETVLEGLRRRAHWVAAHGESGTLANHHALAALGLLEAARVLEEPKLLRASHQRVEQLLQLQHAEGWFCEYGGADPGYQSLTISALARWAAVTGADGQVWQALERAVEFLQWFVHPDGSCGGPYASRGTNQLYAAGLELLAPCLPVARAVVVQHRRALAAGNAPLPDDERLFGHFFYDRLLCWLYGRRRAVPRCGWPPERNKSNACLPSERTVRKKSTPAARIEPEPAQGLRHFPGAGLVVHRQGAFHLVVSTARGGVLLWHAPGRKPLAEGAVVLQRRSGLAVHSAWHDPQQHAQVQVTSQGVEIELARPLAWYKQRLATPAAQAVFHLGMITLGRRLRTPVRWLLQQLLITARRKAPLVLHRRICYRWAGPMRLEVVDRLSPQSCRFRWRRFWLAGDFQPEYVAASCGFQPALLEPWKNLDSLLPVLHQIQNVEVRRSYLADSPPEEVGPHGHAT